MVAVTSREKDLRMIFCCGEALIDMIPSPTESGADGFVPHTGGAVFNTAIALGRLGVPVGMLSGVSTDLFGQQLVDALHASQVNTDALIRSDQPTTLAFVRLNDGHATYTFYDEASAGRSFTAEDLPVLPDTASALYFGGISLCAEPAADAYRAQLESAAADHLIMLDPNIRPSFIQDEARYRSRIDAMVAKSDIIKVSDEDLDWLLPETVPIEDKARKMLARGPSLVIVTKGSAGADGYMATGVAHVDVTKVQVVDTVGAGDTFNAGVLAKLADLEILSKDGVQQAEVSQIEAALAFGAKVAAVTVSRAGANPPWLAEL